MMPKSVTPVLIIGVFIVLAYLTLTQRAQLDINKIEYKNIEASNHEIKEVYLRNDFVKVTLDLRQFLSKLLRYRNNNGKFAEYFSELGINEDEISPEEIKKITLKRNGKIHVKLVPKFGNNIVISYYPVDRIVKSNEQVDEWNDARAPANMLEEIKHNRSLRNRRTEWKCRTNFPLKVSWCKFVEDQQ